MTDNELIELLRQPPKNVSPLRTRSGFQSFFKGIESKKFIYLLNEAYSNVKDPVERDAKIKRRLDLMEGVL